MCGRYNLILDANALIDFFGLVNRLTWRPRYNIAPSQDVPAIRLDAKGRLGGRLHWGLIPHWAKDERFGCRTINARAETVAEKPAFREAFRRRRCLIPATGFYEWRHENGHKQPYHLRVKNAGVFAFAGLWEVWNRPDGRELKSCTIIVTDANAVVRPVHDRMPVILAPRDYDAWMDPGQRNVEALKSLLRPRPADRTEAWAVSGRVGKPANDDPSLIAPL